MPVIGLDEAGRGPILGPMVLAAVAVDPDQADALTVLGVVDSKRFGVGTAAQRERARLARRIPEIASHVGVVVVDVAEIDERTRRGELNRLEQDKARHLLRRAPEAARIIGDGARLFAPLRDEWPALEAVDRGEQHHVAVAAASIVAKARRDLLMERIAARYAGEHGELRGGGYVNPATIAFLRAYISRHGAPPPEARLSWPWEFAADLLGEPPPSQLTLDPRG